MRTLCMYFAVLLTFTFLPGGIDAAKLAPAELVYVQTEGQVVTVRTDLENAGRGSNLAEAFADLENTTAGKVFLDTADYLLVDETSVMHLRELAQWLKGDCLVCIAREVENLSGAATYLDSHRPEVRLEDCGNGNVDLMYLTEMDERFCLKG